MRTASGLPAPRVAAKVIGKGHARKLRFRRFRVRPLRGQVVRFLEEGPQTGRQLARTTASRGTIRFRPGDGKAGPRSIIAVVEQNGMVRRLLVRWTRAEGAERYVVGIRSSDGRRLQLSTRKRLVRVRGFGSHESARVEVTGVRGPYVGRPMRARKRGTR